MSEDKKRKYEEDIEWLDDMVSTAVENGLFNQKNVKVNVLEIFGLIRTAKQKLSSDPPNFPECDFNISRGFELYSKALAQSGRHWRIKYRLGGYIWAYMTAILTAVFFFYYSDAHLTVATSFPVEELAINAVAWGVVGAVLRGYWSLWIAVSENVLRSAWNTYYASVPFIGGILGAITYLIILAGLVTFTAGTLTQIQNQIFVLVVAGLAGFSWEFARDIMRKVMERVGVKEAAKEEGKE